MQLFASLYSVGLVVPGEPFELAFRVSRVNPFFQHRARKSRPRYLYKLVYQDVASSAQIPLEPKPAAQQIGLAVCPSICEVREVQVDACDLSNPVGKCRRVSVVGELNRARRRRRRDVLTSSRFSGGCPLSQRNLLPSGALGGSFERFESDALYGLNECLPRSVRVSDITVGRQKRLDNVGHSNAENDGPMTLPGCARR